MAMRRKKQPTADMLRQQLALAADEIIRLRGELAEINQDGTVILYRGPSVSCRLPWWRRALGWFA